jgi:hypothetical protein
MRNAALSGQRPMSGSVRSRDALYWLRLHKLALRRAEPMVQREADELVAIRVASGPR